MMVHDLKTWPEFYADLLSGAKTFELRKNDRGFEVGDELRLHEWDPLTEQYTGRRTTRKVIYLLEHRPGAGCAATYGLREDYVILAIERLPQGSAGS